MGETFTINAGRIIAEVDCAGESVYAHGNHNWPSLVIQLNLALHGPREERAALDFRELRCHVAPGNQSYIAISDPCPVGYRLSVGHQTSRMPFHVVVPLDNARVATLNRVRAGGNLELRLDLVLHVDELFNLNPQPHPAGAGLWALREHHTPRAQLRVVVPKSHWAENVLPATGHGKVVLVELPTIPFEGSEAWKRSLEALQTAERFERQGLYDEAVAKCRLAIEPFLERVDKVLPNGEKAKVPVLKSSWQRKLGQTTYDWLNASLTAVKQATNEVHHPPSTTFGQVEAQMLLMITTALLSYAVRTSE